MVVIASVRTVITEEARVCTEMLSYAELRMIKRLPFRSAIQQQLAEML